MVVSTFKEELFSKISLNKNSPHLLGQTKIKVEYPITLLIIECLRVRIAHFLLNILLFSISMFVNGLFCTGFSNIKFFG